VERVWRGSTNFSQKSTLLVKCKLFFLNLTVNHDFVQLRKQHSRYKVILASIVFFTAVLWSMLHFSNCSKPAMRLDHQILLKSPSPVTLLAGSAPESSWWNRRTQRNWWLCWVHKIRRIIWQEQMAYGYTLRRDEQLIHPLKWIKLSCTHLRILLNTICRNPGFYSLRTPLNHGAEQASNETLKQTQQRNWSNASQGGQTALNEHLAVLHSDTASTTQQPRGEHRGTIKLQDCMRHHVARTS